MTRPKKNAIVLNMRVDAIVMERFNAYCAEVGQTKTLAFERIVSAFLDKYELEKEQYDRFVKQEQEGAGDA